MALTSISRRTHWFGVALLFISSILLLITTISAPIWNHVSLLDVTLTNATSLRNSSVTFGTFGYCILDVPPVATHQDWCTHHKIGYAPADIMARIDHTSFSEMAAGTSDSLTRVMVLHPIVCVLAFAAFLTSLGSGIIGSLIGAFIAFVTWVLVLISLAVDFSLFSIVKHHVNHDKSGSKATYGSAIWLLLVSFVTLFFGMLIVFFTCCTHQREKRIAGQRAKEEGTYPAASAGGTDGVAAPRKKRFGIF
ncbi:hypothetical protein BAUCODRAFT_61895 [Baudoinia panamericana UAMH 10762]|uniref:Pali-domain-containing protein n=1 Tax=Baudoinia panamericana (strain UAMH 10762) TaxID=717646 RepID=M2N9H2_BAUPA|nr:uncharacterized protein BAUCODRAFT_61895 [Baudoinia panamericana UAMH 10762]EMD00834.1 hypothetical protein BAUCODRAFT_61895 [Baudoinia panamericana UAMH 10762]